MPKHLNLSSLPGWLQPIAKMQSLRHQCLWSQRGSSQWLIWGLLEQPNFTVSLKSSVGKTTLPLEHLGKTRPCLVLGTVVASDPYHSSLAATSLRDWFLKTPKSSPSFKPKFCNLFAKFPSHEIKIRLLLGRKAMTNLDSILKSRDITLSTKVHLVKAMIIPVVMYGCESWTIKKAEHWRIDAFELWCWRTLESPLDSKEIQPVHPKGNQSWIFIGRTDAEAEAETPILWPPDAKNWLTGKDPDAGKDWRWEKMVGLHQWLDGHEFG